MAIHRTQHRPHGFSLLELTIAIAIFVTIGAGVAVPMIGSHLSDLEDRQVSEANVLLSESWEAIRSIRNRDWSALQDGSHGLAFTGGQWILSGGSDIQGGITRVVTLITPQRDPQGNQIDSGGVLDPDSKKAILSLSWQPPYSDLRTLSAEGLLTNHGNPGVWPIPVPEP